MHRETYDHNHFSTRTTQKSQLQICWLCYCLVRKAPEILQAPLLPGPFKLGQDHPLALGAHRHPRPPGLGLLDDGVSGVCLLDVERGQIVVKLPGFAPSACDADHVPLWPDGGRYHAFCPYSDVRGSRPQQPPQGVVKGIPLPT